jgi:hypothetical protein
MSSDFTEEGMTTMSSDLTEEGMTTVVRYERQWSAIPKEQSPHQVREMSGLIDMLTGIHRYFPNTMTTALLVLGLAIGRVSWVLVSIGAIILSIFISLVQFLTGMIIKSDDLPGLMEACSVLPIAGNTYSIFPSYWISITTYFLSYILSNAVSVYKSNPTKQPNTAIAVQQRKGLGVISIVSVLIIGIILLGVRIMSPCESWWGIAIGLILGGSVGYGWWVLLNAQGNDIFQDIHGVMVGLKPGDLRTGPLACVPSA